MSGRHPLTGDAEPERPPMKTREAVVAWRALTRVKLAVPRALAGLDGREYALAEAIIAQEIGAALAPPDRGGRRPG
jgi:hypothetical protein